MLVEDHEEDNAFQELSGLRLEPTSYLEHNEPTRRQAQLRADTSLLERTIVSVSRHFGQQKFPDDFRTQILSLVTASVPELRYESSDSYLRDRRPVKHIKQRRTLGLVSKRFQMIVYDFLARASWNSSTLRSG